MSRPLLVTAHLVSPLAGDPPQLDGLLEAVLAIHHPKVVAGGKIERQFPAPPPGEIGIPLPKLWVGGWQVALCSSPILDKVTSDRHEFFTRRFPTDLAGLLAERERRVVATTGGPTKSYRLPDRVRNVRRVAWICNGRAAELRRVLRRVTAIGDGRARGFGRVERWTFEEAPQPAWWFADSPWGRVLMRPLPATDLGPFVGGRRAMHAVVPPYWHNDRLIEAWVPC